MTTPIPVIDIFAGPGGLGEGFSSFKNKEGKPIFKIKLSVEMDEFAHKTLELRAFFRQFSSDTIPPEYYDYLKNKISREELFGKYKRQSLAAKKEAWKATLGEEPVKAVRTRISEALNGATNWVLIGGPPCQAYSLVGRSRMRGENPWKYAQDHRHHLYKQYLRILADHQPPVFVMENVKGLLSATRTKTNKQNTFDLIIKDLKRPLRAKRKGTEEPLSYHLFSCSTKKTDNKLEANDFVVRSEEYGIPQARHRVIILGIRSDLYSSDPDILVKAGKVSINQVISDLPKLRSGLSKEIDTPEKWRTAIQSIVQAGQWFKKLSPELKKALNENASKINLTLTTGGQFLPANMTSTKLYQFDWYIDKSLDGVCNHESRTHIKKDLQRYFFAAVFAKINKRSPTLDDFPKALLPKHKNIKTKVGETIFNDRFRVQVKGKPSTTVVSHISKDGHYYIHYDPLQCRSLTVREAARLQTFPDNYFFEGTRTQQYHQVGNAVPPLLAKQIAGIVYDALQKMRKKNHA